MEIQYFVYLTMAIAFGVYLGNHPKEINKVLLMIGAAVLGWYLLYYLGIFALVGIGWFLGGGLKDFFHTPFGTLVAYIFIGCLVIYTLYQGLTDFKKPGAVAEFKNDSFRLLFSVLKAVSITLGVFIALFSLILGIFILNTDLNVGLFFIFLALVVCGLFFYWYFKYHRKKIKHDY